MKRKEYKRLAEHAEKRLALEMVQHEQLKVAYGELSKRHEALVLNSVVPEPRKPNEVELAVHRLNPPLPTDLVQPCPLGGDSVLSLSESWFDCPICLDRINPNEPIGKVDNQWICEACVEDANAIYS